MCGTVASFSRRRPKRMLRSSVQFVWGWLAVSRMVCTCFSLGGPWSREVALTHAFPRLFDSRAACNSRHGQLSERMPPGSLANPVCPPHALSQGVGGDRGERGGAGLGIGAHLSLVLNEAESLVRCQLLRHCCHLLADLVHRTREGRLMAPRHPAAKRASG